MILLTIISATFCILLQSCFRAPDKRVNRIIDGELHGPPMFTLKAKIYGMIYNLSRYIAFSETSSYWSALKS